MNRFETEPAAETILRPSPEDTLRTHDLRAFEGLLRHYGRNPERLGDILDAGVFYHRLGEANREHEEVHGEAYAAFRKKLLGLSSAYHEAFDGREAEVSQGTTCTFYRLDPDKVPENISPAVAGYIGVRRLKRALCVGPDGREYLGIPDTPDSRNPVAAFRNGMMMLAFGYHVKRAFPQPFFFVEEVGARDRNGDPVPDLGDEVVMAEAYMEAIHGPSLADIVDGEGRYWKDRLSARLEDALRGFLARDPAYTRDSIRRAVGRWPGLLDIDWAAMPGLYRERVTFMNGMEGGISLHHNDAHFGNVMIPFRSDGTPDPRTFVHIDPDFTVLSTDPTFGSRIEHYIHPYKSTPTRPHLLMPDRIPDDMTPERFGGPIPMDSVTHIGIVLGVIQEHVEALKREPGFLGRMRSGRNS